MTDPPPVVQRGGGGKMGTPKYADIFEKETTKLVSWTIYISIDFMVTKPLLSRTTGRPNGI